MNRVTARPILALLAAVSMAAALAGCSLNYEFTECNTDGDCQTFDNADNDLFYSCDTARNKCVVNEGWECRDSGDCGAGETCNTTSHRCEPTGGGDTGDAGDADAADTDQDTGADAGDAADTVDEPDAPTSCLDDDGEPDHAVCLAQNDNTICTPAGECVDVTSVAGCEPLHYPGTGKSDVISSGRLVILGSIMPQSPPYTDLGTTMVRAIKLAVDEYYSSGAQRLPSGEYVVHLQCDSLQSDPKVIAQHMLDLGVLGIVGPLFSQNYIGVVNDVTAIDSEPDGVYEDGIVTIAPGATSPSIANLAAHGKMSFRLIANDIYQSRAMYERIRILLQNDADPPGKVAVFYKDDQYGVDFQQLLAEHFITENFAGDVKYYQYADPATLDFDPDAITQEFGRVIGASATGGDALPDADVVAFIGTSEAVSLMSAYYLTYANQGALPNPSFRRYVFSHGAAADMPAAAQSIGVPEAVPLMEAVAPDIFGLLDLVEYDNFITRYNIKYGGTVASSVAGVAYDSAATLLLAMAAVPRNQELTAPNVAAVLREGRLQAEGAQVIKFVDPSFFTTAKQAFTLDQNVDLVGVSGELDFIFGEVGGEQVNTGEVLSRYMGLDLAQKKRVGGQQDIFYDAAVTRLYNIPPATTDGAWLWLSATVSGQNSSGVDIPDGDATGVAASANVDECPSTAARDYASVVQVDVDIEHPDVSQLVVKLTHDQTGTEVTLHNQSGTGADLNGTFPTTLITDGSVAPFLGLAPGSSWTLTVADTDADGQTGTLNSFAVDVFCQD